VPELREEQLQEGGSERYGKRMADLLSKKNSVLWASPEKHHRLSIARASSALHSAQVFFEPM